MFSARWLSLVDTVRDSSSKIITVQRSFFVVFFAAEAHTGSALGYCRRRPWRWHTDVCGKTLNTEKPWDQHSDLSYLQSIISKLIPVIDSVLYLKGQFTHTHTQIKIFTAAQWLFRSFRSDHTVFLSLLSCRGFGCSNFFFFGAF